MPFDATPADDSVVALLRRGHARVKEGWCQGRLVRNGKYGPEFCALGAIYIEDAINLMPIATAHATAHAMDAVHILKRVVGQDVIPQWNNAPERTQAEVVDAFERAITLAEQAALTKETVDAV